MAEGPRPSAAHIPTTYPNQTQRLPSPALPECPEAGRGLHPARRQSFGCLPSLRSSPISFVPRLVPLDQGRTAHLGPRKMPHTPDAFGAGYA